jgi:hypothetical protein
MLDAFDRAVIRASRHGETVAQFRDGLVVQRVHRDAVGAEQLVQAAALSEGDGLHRAAARFEPEMALDVLVQRPAEGDVDQLHAPADPKDGQPGADRRVHKGDLEGVAMKVGYTDAVMLTILPVPVGRYVGTAGEQHRVQVADDGFNVVGACREHDRNGARVK